MFHLLFTILMVTRPLMNMYMSAIETEGIAPTEINKVANPANLVGRKCCGSLGLTENILWKSRILIAILMLICQS